MKLKGLSKEELQSLYANLTEAERFFAPYNSTSTEVVLSFIGISDIDEMIKEQKELKQKAAEAEKISKDLAEATGQLAQKDDEIAGLKKNLQIETRNTSGKRPINKPKMITSLVRTSGRGLPLLFC